MRIKKIEIELQKDEDIDVYEFAELLEDLLHDLKDRIESHDRERTVPRLGDLFEVEAYAAF